MSTNKEAAKIIPGPGAAIPPDRSIGAMLIDRGLIGIDDGEKILRYAKEKGLRFGDAAIALKLVDPEDVRQVLARQFDYPYLRPGESKVASSVCAAWSPFSDQVETLRALRSQLLLRWFTGEPERSCLSIVSAGSKEGRSYLAANLAVVFSQLGEHTLLIDADLRAPTQHSLFGLGNELGLSTILADRAGPESIQRVPAFVDLSVLTAGALPPNPLELLARAGFNQLLETLGREYDVIILDSPAASRGSDFLLIAQRARGSLVLARRNRSSLNECAALSQELRSANSTIVGCVLNED